MEDAAGVSIFLCSDILLEVLRCLTRRQIINLESAGGRIHRIVKSCLKREPYITTRFLELRPGLLSFFINLYIIKKDPRGLEVSYKFDNKYNEKMIFIALYSSICYPFKKGVRKRWRWETLNSETWGNRISPTYLRQRGPRGETYTDYNAATPKIPLQKCNKIRHFTGQGAARWNFFGWVVG